MALALVNPSNPFGKLFWLIVIVALVFVGVSHMGSPNTQDSSTPIALTAMDLTYDQMRIIEIVSGHAWENHGDEVNKAIKCLRNNGTLKSFKTSGFADPLTNSFLKTNLWICQDNDGKLYSIVTTAFEKVGGNQIARLITAYEIAKDIFPTLDDFVTYIADKWQAIAITYLIPAGQDIFLSPK